jgi:membrane fusion protein (multidrug efflux system)
VELQRRRLSGHSALFLFALLILCGSGCRKSGGSTQAASTPPPPSVQVAVVDRQDVSLSSEWIATLDGYVNAQIQPHVSGYLIRQNYREGSSVRQGDVLFEIDPRPFQASVDQSRAQVAQAEAQLGQARAQLEQSKAEVIQAQAQLSKAQQDVTRDTPLADAKAIAQSRLDDDLQVKAGATAAVDAAKAKSASSEAAIAAATAAVSAAKAAVEQSELNLSFTKITSLVDGVAGIAQAQIGDLVATTTVLTSVSQLDPIKVYFPMAEQDYLRVQNVTAKSAKSGTPLDGVPLILVLSDGSTYPHSGKVLWTDRQIETTTGTIRVAAAFPNPGNILRPGQYGKVRAVTEKRRGALLVPQAGVSELQGNYQVAVVNAENKVEIHPVKIGAQVDGNWIVDAGVAAGDKVIVGGMQYAQPGATVNPVPVASSGAVSSPAKEQ